MHTKIGPSVLECTLTRELPLEVTGEVGPTKSCSAPKTVGARQEFNGFIQMYFTPEDFVFLSVLYDFYHKFLSGTLLVYPIRMKTVLQ